MTVDLSPQAVTARLRLVSELRDVCLALVPRRSPNGTERPSKDLVHPQLGCEVAEGTKANSASLTPE